MKQRPVSPPPPATEDDDVAALQAALRGVAVLAAPNRAHHERARPVPQPLQHPAAPPAEAAAAPRDMLVDDYRAATPLKAQNRAMPPQPVRVARPERPAAAPDSDFAALIGPTTPLDDRNRLWLDSPRPPPLARQRQLDDQQVLQDSLSDQLPWIDEDDNGDELLFLRPGLPRDILRKLRRGDWVVQAEIDFHGCTVDEARERFVAFMHSCLERGSRCLRLVHGKGLSSHNREPVIKPKLRGWLMQREEVLAFCPARPFDGGHGAVIVLLRGSKISAAAGDA